MATRSLNHPHISSFGAKTVLLEWEAKIDLEIHREVLLWKNALQSSFSDHIDECTPAYNSLMVFLKSDAVSFAEQLKGFVPDCFEQERMQHFIYELPVCYEHAFAPDLPYVCKHTGLSPEEMVQLHTQHPYPLYFYGFLPGFPYLGGLNPALTTPRKSNPDHQVPKGAVALGGNQTGIYPRTSPGGWQVIGNCPIDVLQLKSVHQNWLVSGDLVQFKPISIATYEALKKNEMEWNFNRSLPDD